MYQVNIELWMDFGHKNMFTILLGVTIKPLSLGRVHCGKYRFNLKAQVWFEIYTCRGLVYTIV